MIPCAIIWRRCDNFKEWAVDTVVPISEEFLHRGQRFIKNCLKTEANSLMKLKLIGRFDDTNTAGMSQLIKIDYKVTYGELTLGKRQILSKSYKDIKVHKKQKKYTKTHYSVK